jgi:DNA-directed RNA polymerase specialized sigma24 family protein
MNPSLDIPMVLAEDLGGYVTVAQRFIAYLDEPVPDAELVRIAQAIAALRVEPGQAENYNAFLFHVSLQWPYRRVARHLAIHERTVRRRVARARQWVLDYLVSAQAA